MWHNYGISCYVAYYLWVIRQFKPSLYFNNRSCNPVHAVHLYIRLIAPALQLRGICGRVIRALRVLPMPEKITDPKKITLRKILLGLLETNIPFTKIAGAFCMRVRNRQISVCDTCVLSATVFNPVYVIYQLSKAQFINSLTIKYCLCAIS
jgi:hypothetical protein